MVLSTLGIGFGFHWSISGNVSIDYSETYRMSWRMCGYAALFGLVSSLVLFCEIGIVGDISGDTSHYHVFYERKRNERFETLNLSGIYCLKSWYVLKALESALSAFLEQCSRLALERLCL